MHFIDLGAQQEQLLPDGITIREAVEARIASVLDHGRFILGPEVEELEAILASFVGVEHSQQSLIEVQHTHVEKKKQKTPKIKKKITKTRER